MRIRSASAGSSPLRTAIASLGSGSDCQTIAVASAGKLPPSIGNVEFVPIDFVRDSLDKILDKAGHDRSLPTCWIWEGVVMYLARDVVRATLAGIARRSARGSTLVVNYHGPGRGFFAMLIFRLMGEPQISFWTKEEMEADLRAAGFVVRSRIHARTPYGAPLIRALSERLEA